MNKRVLIALTTFNRISFTKQCLESLFKNTTDCFDLVIFDNGSTDGTVEYLKQFQEKHTEIYTNFNNKNIGVAPAINVCLGLRKQNQHFMKLDNDIVFDNNIDKNWLNNICDILDSNIEIDFDNKKFGFGAICLKPDKLLKEFEQKISFRLKEKDYTFEYNPEGVLGCCTIYNSINFDKIKKFNDEMGLYGYEDSLMNIRLFKMNRLCFFETSTKCYHIDPGGETDYLKWKHDQAIKNNKKYKELFESYVKETRDVSI